MRTDFGVVRPLRGGEPEEEAVLVDAEGDAVARGGGLREEVAAGAGAEAEADVAEQRQGLLEAHRRRPVEVALPVGHGHLGQLRRQRRWQRRRRRQRLLAPAAAQLTTCERRYPQI